MVQQQIFPGKIYFGVTINQNSGLFWSRSYIMFLPFWKSKIHSITFITINIEMSIFSPQNKM